LQAKETWEAIMDPLAVSEALSIDHQYHQSFMGHPIPTMEVMGELEDMEDMGDMEDILMRNHTQSMKDIEELEISLKTLVIVHCGYFWQIIINNFNFIFHILLMLVC
jgi:hypothetical protein